MGASAPSMDGHRLSQKRRRPLSAVDLGEALCKRLRGARLSLLARIDAGAAGDDMQSSCKVLPPALARHAGREEDALQPRALRSMPPGDLNARLLRPLPAARARQMIGPLPGECELWDIAKPNDAPRSTREDPLSYLDYLSWLQQVLPKSMQPVKPAGTAAEPEDAEGGDHLSALDLLRRLASLSEPCGGVPPLTDEERQLAENGLDDGNAEEVLASRFNVEVKRKQLWCLRPGQWLNDEVINFYCKLLEERAKKSADSPKVWFPNSFFWPKLSGADNKVYSYKDVKRWTIKAKIDIFELDHVIFPMNIGESHWALGAIDIKNKGFRYFDSMFCRPHRNFVPFLQKYLQDEHKAKKGKDFVGADEWDLIMPDDPVPQQNNGYDCGVFTCNFAECFSSGRELGFTQDDMPDLRMRLAARVMGGTEDWH